MYGYFPYIALFRLTSEASTFFINFRWFLLSVGKKDSLLYLINGIFILVVFGVFRLLSIPPVWYSFYISIGSQQWKAVPTVYKFLCCATSLPLDILNVYWYSKIIYGLKKVLAKKVDSSHKNDVKTD
jgi:hypothetical protein